MISKNKNIILNYLFSLKYMGFEYVNPINIDKTKKIEQELSDDLDELETTISNCNLCLFSKTRRNTLAGLGNKNADVIFLSLAPSSFDDESGDMLSGNSGVMFTQMSQNVLNIPINELYILTLLKCIPSTKDMNVEVNICKLYFQKQIEIIKPKIIVAFGDVYKYLLANIASFEEIRGTMQDYNSIKLMPTYHPSFILRNPSVKKDVLNDLKKVKIIMESP
ncbi:Uracil-DNA glycosylase, family 4 [hydrothermal vent metagenome]|uniref:Uracil-DNA glycosylase, family 4 n=1 Tax=hydrothermal vent metagenome TaxID=652676 RepID=A0A3B1E568_9ZZZZ